MHPVGSTEAKRTRGISSFLSGQDLCTLLNATCGVLATFGAIRGQFSLAVLLLLGAVLCDYLDGKLGRWLGTSHVFGKELDSLADVVGFGMAPCVVPPYTSARSCDTGEALRCRWVGRSRCVAEDLRAQ